MEANRSPRFIVGIILVIVIVIFLIPRLFHSSNTSNTTQQPTQSDIATYTLPITPPNDVTTKGVVDNYGQAVTNTGAVSNSVITLSYPTAGTKVQNGIGINGYSVESEVGYRLSDNVKGLLQEGTLQVNSGQFSGSLTFFTNATFGTLEVFSLNPITRVPENILKINVAFQ